MPHAFDPHPDHPAVLTLLRLHADIGGRILANKQEAAKLREDMRHVEAVIKMFDPAFSLRPIAVKRRERNPWFKRGTIFRQAMDVLRTALSRERARRRTARIEAARSGGRCRAFPLLGSFSSEAAERSAGDQVALNVEGVVDCRMSGEEALR